VHNGVGLIIIAKDARADALVAHGARRLRRNLQKKKKKKNTKKKNSINI
jgi:hypothetical protein